MLEEKIAHINYFIENTRFYASILMPTTGLFTNILNIIICLRKTLRTNLVGYYNFTISTWNILLFITFLIVYLPPIVYKQDLTLKSNTLCWSLSYVSRIMPQMAIWSNVLLTIDRFMSVSFPGRCGFRNNRKILSFILLGMFVLILILNTPNIFYKILIENNGTRVCSSTKEIVLIRNIVIALFGIVLPAVTHIILSLILIVKLFSSRRNATIRNQSEKRDRRFSLIVLALNVLFCLTQLPYSLITIYVGVKSIVPTQFLSSTSESYSQAVVSLVFYVTFILAGFNFNSLLVVNLMLRKIMCRAKNLREKSVVF